MARTINEGNSLDNVLNSIENDPTPHRNEEDHHFAEKILQGLRYHFEDGLSINKSCKKAQINYETFQR